jgi:hypothetical protein
MPAVPGAAPPAPAPTADEDVALRAAVEVLRGAHAAGAGSTRAELKAAAAPVIAAVARREELGIEAALAARGVDWSAPGEAAVAGVPILEVETPGEVVLQPGLATRMSLRVRNTGTAAAHRVWGRTSSANPLLANYDLVFGRIPPGGAAEASVEIPVPAWAWLRYDTFALNLKREGADAGSATGGALTVGGSQPVLTYAITLGDANALVPAPDGDGRLESVRLQVRVSGDGDPGDLRVRLSPEPPESMSLPRRESSVGVAEGEEASFTGRLPAAGERETLHLAVSLSSPTFGRVLLDGIDFPLDGPYPARIERRPPQVAAREIVPERTRADAITLKFSVTDETSVKDVLVRVDGRKVFYHRGGKDVLSLPLELLIGLAGGSNRIEIVARDSDDLVTLTTYFVYRLAG